MKKWLIFLGILFSAGTALAGTNTEILNLSGRDADAPVNWAFKVSAGRRAGVWTTIPVPSNWELQGFGCYNYGHDKNPADEIGFYKHTFVLPQSWAQKRIFLVFDGSMTDTEARVNGKLVGPVHQGGFYRFKYEITRFVHFRTPNLLEVNPL
jgi:beta-galactosidase/beta-glucuronidase